MTDLIVLTADKDAHLAFDALLRRHEALDIRRITWSIIRSPEHDPGVLRQCALLLQLYVGTHRHALVVLDRRGCGKEHCSREELEQQLERELSENGWRERCAAIVLDPELEAWVWSDSPEVGATLGWAGRSPDLHSWLRNAGYLGVGDRKPKRPKEAMQQALREVRTPRSSALFAALAKKVSVRRCNDPAFDKLRATLNQWFPFSGAIEDATQ